MNVKVIMLTDYNKLLDIYLLFIENIANNFVNIFKAHYREIYFLPVLHGEYSENFENESVAVKQVPTGSRRRLLNEK